jgi:hypothetical protein
MFGHLCQTCFAEYCLPKRNWQRKMLFFCHKDETIRHLFFDSLLLVRFEVSFK